MKAINEIGFKKSIRYVFLGLIMAVYHLLIDHLLPFSPARKIFLGILGAKVGKNSVIMGVKFINLHHQGFAGLAIGENCFIGDETLVDLYDRVLFEDHVTIAQRVNIVTHLNVGYKNHPLQESFPKFSKPVVFKSGSVVATASTILPGIIIGKQSFVAAGSVVTKDVPPKTLVAGVPAKTVRKID